jgi:hypothetical protein
LLLNIEGIRLLTLLLNIEGITHFVTKYRGN